jgi:hypothetical protein
MNRVKFNLRNVAIIACLAATTTFAACEPADEPNAGAPAFAEFTFAGQRGTADIDAKKRTVKAVAECGTNIASLAPEFKLSPEGATAAVDGKAQESGKTANSYADAVVYTLATPDGATAEWTVTVTLPDDCPQVKKYITYNKPVTAYYIEYTEDGESKFEAYENKEYCHSFDGYYIYIGSEEIEYSGAGNNHWYKHTGDPVQVGSWLSRLYKNYEYPLGDFAAYVSERVQGGGFMRFISGPNYLPDIALYPDVYKMPNNTDVTEFYIKSEKVCDIMCDVYKDSQNSSRGTETFTFWVDPATGLTLKFEWTGHGESKRYEVTKLVFGKPDWDGKHLRPKAGDTITNVD